MHSSQGLSAFVSFENFYHNLCEVIEDIESVYEIKCAVDSDLILNIHQYWLPYHENIEGYIKSGEDESIFIDSMEYLIYQIIVNIPVKFKANGKKIPRFSWLEYGNVTLALIFGWETYVRTMEYKGYETREIIISAKELYEASDRISKSFASGRNFLQCLNLPKPSDLHKSQTSPQK